MANIDFTEFDTSLEAELDHVLNFVGPQRPQQCTAESFIADAQSLCELTAEFASLTDEDLIAQAADANDPLALYLAHRLFEAEDRAFQLAEALQEAMAVIDRLKR